MFIGVVLASHVAWAHELITDSTHRVGVVLHVEPDDMPLVAGSKSKLEFIMQGLVISSATLRINDARVPVVLGDGVVSVEYVFPAQGRYTLEFDVHAKKDGQQYTFIHVLQVSHGVGAAVGERHQEYLLATFSLIGLVIVILGLRVVVWRRRRAIMRRNNHR